VEENDIVVASSGNTYGKIGRIKAEHLPIMMNTSVIRFHSLNKNELDDDFLYAWLRSIEFSGQVEGFVTGGAQPNFGPTHLKQMHISLPNINTQKSIASILSTYDDLIENNRRRMALLEDAARQVYQEWFVRLRFPGYEHTRMVDGVPEGWEKKNFGEICYDVREAVLPEALEPDTPYIGLEHIPRRSISLTEWGNAEQVTSTKLRFREGEILFGKIRPYFHKVGISFIDGVASSDTIIIRPSSTKLHGLVLTTVSSDPFVANTSQTMKEGSKMPRADWKQMQEYPVAVPPDGLLCTFNDTISSITAQLKNLTFQNQKLRAARDLLLPKLMSGEIAV
jgi:type I restriction enzyme S subunit